MRRSVMRLRSIAASDRWHRICEGLPMQQAAQKVLALDPVAESGLGIEVTLPAAVSKFAAPLFGHPVQTGVVCVTVVPACGEDRAERQPTERSWREGPKFA